MSTPSFYPIFEDLEPLTQQPQLPVDTPCQLNNHDYQQARAFLLSYSSTPSTFNAYRSEVEKFCQWMVNQSGDLSLRSVTPDQIKRYAQFLTKIPVSWTHHKRTRKFVVDPEQGCAVGNPEWRPFVMIQTGKRRSITQHSPQKGSQQKSQQALPAYLSLSKNSIASSFRVLSSLFQFLIEEEYIDKNPVKRLRQKGQLLGKQQQQAPIRRLSELQWSYAIGVARTAADEAPPESQAERERNLFILTLLFGLYLRISELVESDRWQPQMNHFYQDSDRHWWFKTVGKGNKERDVVVSDAVLESLKRYRQALGYTALPSRTDDAPLIPSLSRTAGRGGIRSTRHIRRLVQQMFDAAYEAMVVDQLAEEADAFQAATAHWLRHTGISEDVKVRPREHVRDDAGHSSSLTTDRYIDVERRARHQSGRQRPLDQLT